MGTFLHEWLVHEDRLYFNYEPKNSHNHYGDQWLGLTDNGKKGYWYDIFGLSWQPYLETYLPMEEISMVEANNSSENCLTFSDDWFAGK